MIVNKIIPLILTTILFSECADGYQEYNNECYYNNDIEFLNVFIDNNCSDYDQNNYYTTIECFFGPNSNVINDMNQDGIVQPIEFCDQLWVSSRLTGFDCFNDNNEPLVGSIPLNVGDLTNLEYLYLGNNNLEGSIPGSIGNLTNLHTLDLSGNFLTGNIPSSIGNLNNLYMINLMHNNLEGEIPSTIGSLENLAYLLLNSNQLSGEMINEIFNLTNLIVLQLQDNNLEGEIYPNIQNSAEDKKRTNKYLENGNGPLVGFELSGGKNAGKQFIDNLKMIYHVANIGDVRTLAIHPASTTHSQLSQEDQLRAGVTPGYIRLSVGIEYIDDILEDIDQAINNINTSNKKVA